MEEKTTILYVDDEVINLQLFEINFRRKFHVLTAQSGTEGLEILESNPSISIVISDMQMPEMNGIEFIRKASESYPLISFFILTGYDITNEIEDALKEELIYKYFNKPFNIREIESSIEMAIQTE